MAKPKAAREAVPVKEQPSHITESDSKPLSVIEQRHLRAQQEMAAHPAVPNGGQPADYRPPPPPAVEPVIAPSATELFPVDAFHAEFLEAVNLGARVGTKPSVNSREYTLKLYREGLWIGARDKAGRVCATFVSMANLRHVSLTSANFDNSLTFAARAG